MRTTFGFWASAFLSVALTTGCDDPDPVEGGETSGSTGADDTTSTSTAGMTTSVSSTAVTTDPVTSTTTTTTTTTTTDDDTTAGDETAGETGCALGSVGCMCDAGQCDAGLACDDDVCIVSGTCEGDELEPNEDEASAIFVGEINDDDESGSTIEGVLSGPSDIDWFRYTGDDDAFSSVDPTRFIDASAGVRICKFVECVNGLPNTEITCPDETESTMSPTGRPGCCAPLGMEVDDLNCSGTTEDSMEVYIRVDEAAAACVDYEITFHF